MKQQKIVKKLANKIANYQDPDYEVMWYDAESILRLAIQEFGYRAIQKITIGELISGIEKNIPTELVLSNKIIITRDSL